MKESELGEFSGLLTCLGENYQRPLSKGLVRLYWEMLKPFPMDQFKEAIKHILTTRQYSTFPQVADFVQYIHPAEDLAWQAAKAIKELLYRLENRYISFRFNDPYIAEVVDLKGGWQRVCDSFPDDPDDQRFWLKDFDKLYTSVVKAMRSALPEARRMIGLLEAANTQKGYITNDKGRPIQGENGFIWRGSEEAQKYLIAPEQELRRLGGKMPAELLLGEIKK